MMKIGLLNVKGAVPAFENFGNLPTHLVNSSGLAGGGKAHEVLDGIIIPGGSIVESESMTPELASEINTMARNGKFVLGICSGFQTLALKTDIGRKSPCPIEKEGLGLVDVSFSPMISNDRVEAKITSESFLTKGLVGKTINGFHCHTYGHITENDSDNAKPIFYSKIKRVNYTDDTREVLAGVTNAEGNVVGTMIHGCLDNNSILVENILKFMGADDNDRLQISEDNKILVEKIKGQLGIETSLYVAKKEKINSGQDIGSISNGMPPVIMVGSTGSDSGKTFLVTGLAGAFRRKGLKVGVLKVGPDVRDIVPSLYLTKEKMEYHSSIKIGHLGWMGLEDVLKSLELFNYDLVIIEGVMSVFTGLLNEKIPYSSAEIALAANIPVILVSGCSKGGIETAALNLVSHRDMLVKMGIEVPGIIFNRVYDSQIFQKASQIFKNDNGLEMIGEVPKVKLSKRGGTPEVEIKLEEFCLMALKTVEENLDVDKIISLAKKPVFKGYKSIKEIERTFNL
ncbi:MAG: cobyrinic acid a,c-diamide synthase [Methanobacteriales archaeon HGW-Methanobacteriales-1]|nr:MAG: cobyrinic acid a,c-diamide synthase [Methanobacteriales archaeon HGW-Methanobacteriales-1]